jgi:O-antigen/teichoic acid export membrane protein
MSTSKDFARNSIWAVFIHLAPRIANVLVFIVIGRLAGPADAGIFALATTYLIISTTIMKGIDDLVIREITRKPSQAPTYLNNFFILRLFLSALIYLAVWVIIVSWLDYPSNTTMPILIITLSVVPDSLTLVGQSILLGQRQFAAAATVMSGIAISKVLICGLLALYSNSLIQIAWFWFFVSLIGMIVMLLIAIRSVGGLQFYEWHNWELLTKSWRTIGIFLILTILTTFESQTDIILLSVLKNEADVGWYNAATTIAFSLAMISQAFRMSVYPLLTKYAQQNPDKLIFIREQSLRILGILVIPMAGGIALLAPQIVDLIYGREFIPTIPALRILAPVLIFLFLNVPNSRTMLAYDRQSQVMVFLILSASVNVLLNLILDGQYGATGASFARLISTSLYFGLTYIYVEHYLAKSKLIRLLYKSAIATIVMLGTVWYLRDHFLLFTITIGALLYFFILWVIGGISREDFTLIRNIITTQGSVS